MRPLGTETCFAQNGFASTLEWQQRCAGAVRLRPPFGVSVQRWIFPSFLSYGCICPWEKVSESYMPQMLCRSFQACIHSLRSLIQPALIQLCGKVRTSFSAWSLGAVWGVSAVQDPINHPAICLPCPKGASGNGNAIQHFMDRTERDQEQAASAFLTSPASLQQPFTGQVNAVCARQGRWWVLGSPRLCSSPTAPISWFLPCCSGPDTLPCPLCSLLLYSSQWALHFSVASGHYRHQVRKLNWACSRDLPPCAVCSWNWHSPLLLQPLFLQSWTPISRQCSFGWMLVSWGSHWG